LLQGAARLLDDPAVDLVRPAALEEADRRQAPWRRLGRGTEVDLELFRRLLGLGHDHIDPAATAAGGAAQRGIAIRGSAPSPGSLPKGPVVERALVPLRGQRRVSGLGSQAEQGGEAL